MSKGLFGGASAPAAIKVPDPAPTAVADSGQTGDSLAAGQKKKKRGFDSTVSDATILGNAGQDTKRTLG